MRLRSIILAAILLLPVHSFAQTPSVQAFDVLQLYSPWLTSSNRAGLNQLPVGHIARAGVEVVKSDGGYRNLYESSNALEARIGAQAYSHATQRLTFYGDMNYSYNLAEDMGGPVMMNPDYNAINFYEYPDDNHGRRTKELYTLNAGMSCQVSNSFSIGVGAAYQAGNVSKRKDPRDLSRWMDFGLSFGVMNRFSDMFSLGADFRYRRTVETLSSRTYGVTGTNYFYFVDYGASLGKVEVLGSDNYFVATSTERPMLNTFYGPALQFEVGNPRGELFFFSELSYLRRTGSYGDKADSEILFSANTGNEFRYDGVVSLRYETKHRISLGLLYGNYSNSINSFSVLSQPGEDLLVEYYGPVKTQDRTIVEGKLGYEALIGGVSLHPLWRVSAQMDFRLDNVDAYYYPYTRNQKAETVCLSAGVARSISAGKNVFDLGFSAGFRAGFGVKAADGILAEVSGPGPRTAQEYLDRSWEYRTAPSAMAGLSFVYTRRIKGNFSFFAGVDGKTGFLVKKPGFLDGRFRSVVTLTVGCNF